MLHHKKETNIHSSVRKILKPLDKQWYKWVLSLWLLSASCLTPIFTVPFFASRSNISNPNDQNINNTQIIESFLEKTLYEQFEEHLDDSSYSFKYIFFAGFAISQITIGFLGDYFGKWPIFKHMIEILNLTETINGIFLSTSASSKFHIN